MQIILSMIILVLIGFVGVSYAEPLSNINTEILNVNDSDTSIQISWNHDESVDKYEAGCVSCIPNTSQTTTADFVLLQDISALRDGHAILYIVAYDASDEIITAKQIILLLG